MGSEKPWKLVLFLALPSALAQLINVLYNIVDRVYIEEILPAKMQYNLKAIEDFSFFGDIKTMFMTVFAVLGKEYQG